MFFSLTALGAGPEDPGVRGGHVDAGQSFSGMNSGQQAFFNDGQARFEHIDSVSGTISGEPNGGLGPRYNSISCVSCHAQPAPGGSSPSRNAYPYLGPNPQIEAATHDGASNRIPSFITANGPVREVRFKYVVSSSGGLTNTPDGGVHDLFTITGRPDATNAIGISGSPQTCTLSQPDFERNQSLGNLSFRIPTPTFGSGLVENISENTILANQAANASEKRSLGISGMVNRNGNDGTITRFGWKAQNKSLTIFSGEAYNVEMGVTNELFQSERPSPGETLPTSCYFNGTPEDSTIFSLENVATQIPSDVTQFATFMRFLDQPVPSTITPGGAPSIANGRNLFVNEVKCALCHTPSLPTTGSSFIANLNFANANLFSDLLVHHMGNGLSDGITQGTAGPDQFRTAPLWGVGQRVFFLHDGRTSDIQQAIEDHASSGSEANAVVANFNKLSTKEKQDLLNFLRSL